MQSRSTRRSSAVAIAITVAGTCFAVTSSCVGTGASNIKQASPSSTSPGTESSQAPPDCAQSLPASAKAGQMLMVMVAAPGKAAVLLANGVVGGLGVKGAQDASVGDEVRDAIVDSPIPPFIASDEEGGGTQRLIAALGTLPSAFDQSDKSSERAGRTMGSYAAKMKSIGFNMLLGPVADTGTGARYYGSDPKVVSEFVNAVIAGVSEAGVTPVMKHWPGVSSEVSRQNDSVTAVEAITELRSSSLLPFESAFLQGAPAVMVAHVSIPGLTELDEPASLSRNAITGELRGNQGFDGIVMTESLGLGAIVSTTSQSQAAETAISAGADIALVSGTDAAEAAYKRLTDAIRTGRLDPAQVEQSVRRILDAKGIKGPCPDVVATMTRLDQEVVTKPTESQSQSGQQNAGSRSDQIETPTTNTKVSDSPDNP